VIFHIYLRQQTVLFSTKINPFLQHLLYIDLNGTKISRGYGDQDHHCYSAEKLNGQAWWNFFKWDGVILAHILIVHKHFWNEGPSMSLPNKYNYQTYQSDLPVLYMVKIFLTVKSTSKYDRSI
jgi:hypothetical protein